MSILKNLFSAGKNKALSYAEFWAWFKNNEKKFFQVLSTRQNVEDDFLDVIGPKLEEIREGYFFLAGMLTDDCAELVITADGNLKTIVFVEELIAAAPLIKGWKFTACKPAIEIEDMAIDMNDFEFSSKTISFYYNEDSDYPDEIDITLVHQDYSEEKKSEISTGCLIYLDNLLGELYSVSIIDNMNVCGPAEAEKETIPVSKLKDFLVWREKEFIEKYQATVKNTETANYAMFEMKNAEQQVSIGMMNTDLLNWDAKPSHPWMMIVTISYDGSANNGMPEETEMHLMDQVQDAIEKDLKDVDGYLSPGRITGEGSREIYFACKDFRKPSKVLTEITSKQYEGLQIEFEIFKDKYWRSLERFSGN